MSNIKFGEFQEMALPKEKPPQAPLNPKNRSFDEQGVFSLYILESEIETIQKHLDENPEIESGGLLIGHPFININNPGNVFTLVVDSARVKSANSSIGHYTVSPEELVRARSKIPEGLISVGWYHSHPGHGVFLSGADMAIMESIYCSNWQIAFVFDTFSRKSGFFCGKKGNRVENIFYLDRKPATIEAITRYNCALSAKEEGNDSVFESFKNWLRKSPINELSHWVEKGKYQNIQLDAITFSSAPDSEWQKEFKKAVNYYNSEKFLTAKLVFEYLYEIKNDVLVNSYLKRINERFES